MRRTIGGKMKDYWLNRKEYELKLKIREELRASMEKEWHIKMQEIIEFINLEIRADIEKLEDKIEALEQENRVLRMANLVGVKIVDKLNKGV